MEEPGLFTLPCKLGGSNPFDTLADLGSCVNIIPLYLFKKLKIRLLEETDHVFGLADETKSYHIRIVRDVEVHIRKLKLLNEFYVIDMKKEPETPLLVGRGFLATANAVIDCRKSRIAVRERITRSSPGQFDSEMTTLVLSWVMVITWLVKASSSGCHKFDYWKNLPSHLPRACLILAIAGFPSSLDGIFEIDLSNSLTNESSVYAVRNKRAKLDLDSALLWHCRLGHISKKRVEKLQHEGVLNSSDLTAFEKCVSCMSGKMARKPYTHQVERAKDLLGLIHTYDHGIITHRTPPYTPQYNGVSERRNKTLLDTVRSMMSQTTLPKSFWDYALETAARILNMVPTKKVEKTPYEVWNGKVPKIPKKTMGYSFYYPPENKVLVARNAEFLENSLIDQEASGSLEDLEIIQEEDMHPSLDTSLNHEEEDLEIDEPQSDIVPIRRSTRT
nr:hypothetical protein [Tanacetum cinerariifolium]